MKRGVRWAAILISDRPLYALTSTDGRNFLFTTVKCFWF
nr:MAG TPA: hypothetical protein [Caudoviricetes sp.]